MCGTPVERLGLAQHDPHAVPWPLARCCCLAVRAYLSSFAWAWWHRLLGNRGNRCRSCRLHFMASCLAIAVVLLMPGSGVMASPLSDGAPASRMRWIHSPRLSSFSTTVDTAHPLQLTRPTHEPTIGARAFHTI